ncbi:MAG: YdcF family protein [Actinomycetota bacterium]|nr:YdcF family protein [Actinomycetota bacterium]
MGPHVADLTVASEDEALRLARIMQAFRVLGGGRPPLAIVGADRGSPLPDGAEVIVLPGAKHRVPQTARSVIRGVISDLAGMAIVVPGAGRLDARGRYVLSASAYGRLRAAEALVASNPTAMVILSGWSGGQAGATEAEQLQDQWNGPRGTPLLLETAARTTAENAVNAVSLAASLSGCRELIFVAPWSNAVRQGLLARAAARGTGLRTRQHVVWGRAHLRSLRPGITGLLFMRRHLRVARARARDVGS